MASATLKHNTTIPHISATFWTEKHFINDAFATSGGPYYTQTLGLFLCWVLLVAVGCFKYIIFIPLIYLFANPPVRPESKRLWYPLAGGQKRSSLRKHDEVYHESIWSKRSQILRCSDIMTIRHFWDRSWLILNIKRTLIKFSHAFKAIEKNKYVKTPI